MVNESFLVNSCVGFYREIAKAKYGSMNLLPILLGFLDSLDFMLDRNGDELLGTSAWKVISEEWDSQPFEITYLSC